MRKNPIFILGLLALSCLSSVWAAVPVNLQGQSVLLLQSFLKNTPSSSSPGLKEIKKSIDFNQTTHVRLKQIYSGYPVWGAEVIVHVPRGGKTTLGDLPQNTTASMNGVLYQNLSDDLSGAPSYIFNKTQADNALKHAIELYQQKSGVKESAAEGKTNLVVYIDEDNKAHWAFLVSFSPRSLKAMPEKPVTILDAVTFKVYKQWNNIQTLDPVSGGGFGGNENTGKISYDGLPGDLSVLTLSRDEAAKRCYLKNDDVTVENARKRDRVSDFACDSADKDHNAVYWDATLNSVNGAYSPDNDALYAGKVIKEMYQKWYNVPVLTDNGKPMMLVMRVHEQMENAYWDGQQMTFGDGGSTFYPLVSLGVGAHEISHGFTEQHSNLIYDGQSGGLNESFSDMAAQAAEFYSVGHNSWQIGPEIMKEKGTALRYMDEPTKDCEGRKPGDNCSISNAKNYKKNLDVHYSSGVFNKLFYLLGTAENWDTKKAFDVMVQANENYWIANETFVGAACGVLTAVKDYKYDAKAVQKAMKKVGISTSKCQ